MGIDRTGEIVYNESMEKSKLTRENVRMIGVPQELHARLKSEAKGMNKSIYEFIEMLLDKASRYDAMIAVGTPKDTTDARP